MHKSVQLARMMGNHIASVAYTTTNQRHGNNKPVIVYTVKDMDMVYANDAVVIARSN